MLFLIDGVHFVAGKSAQAVAKREYGYQAVVIDDMIYGPDNSVIATIHCCNR